MAEKTRRIHVSVQWTEAVPLDTRIAVGEVYEVDGRELVVHAVALGNWEDPGDEALVYMSDKASPSVPFSPSEDRRTPGKTADSTFTRGATRRIPRSEP
jgi:hypothetical protein